MKELKLNGYNLLNPTKGKEQKIIDCFVQFFGEEYRNIVTERYNNTTLLVVPNNTFLEDLEKAKKREQTNLLEEFYKNVNYQFNKVVNRVFVPEYALNLKNNIKSGNLTRDDYKMLCEILFCKFNVSFNKKGKEIVDAWLTVAKDKKQIVSFLDEVFVKWKESEQCKKWHKINLDVKNVIETIEKINFLNIHQEKDIAEKMRETILNKFAQIKNVSKEELLTDANIEKHIVQMRSIAINATTNFLTDEWESQINKDIELFKFLGFNYGAEYDKYLNDSNLFQEIFDENFIDEIRKLWVILQKNSIKNDVFLNNAYKVIQNKNFYYDKQYCWEEINNLSIGEAYGYAFTLCEFDDKKRLTPICVYPPVINCSDDVFIHELCHALSSTGQIPKKYKAKVKIGVSTFDYIRKDNNGKNVDIAQLLEFFDFEDIQRNHNMLNEVLTDYFAYKILDIFNQKNVKVFMGKNKPSGYAWMFGMMRELIEENIDVFKKAYITSNIHELEEIMTCEEINMLDDILKKIFTISFKKNKFDKFEKEIREKTNIKEYAMFNVKKFINKDINWSTEIRDVFEYYNKIDELAEKIRNRKNKEMVNGQTIIR